MDFITYFCETLIWNQETIYNNILSQWRWLSFEVTLKKRQQSLWNLNLGKSDAIKDSERLVWTE